MYVQCTMYMTLCRRWRAYNRVILVQNAPSRFGNPATTTVTLTSEQPNKLSSSGVKRKGDKKSPAAAPVQSVVTIASAFTGSNLRTKNSNHTAAVVEPGDEAIGINQQLTDANPIVNSESLHAEEMAALLDLKIHPSPSRRSVVASADTIPSIQNQ